MCMLWTFHLADLRLHFFEAAVCVCQWVFACACVLLLLLCYYYSTQLMPVCIFQFVLHFVVRELHRLTHGCELRKMVDRDETTSALVLESSSILAVGC